MRFYRWGCVGYAFGKDWEHHVFPALGRPDDHRALCGLHVGGITRPQRGDMQGKCEACALLAPEAEALEEAHEAGREDTWNARSAGRGARETTTPSPSGG